MITPYKLSPLKTIADVPCFCEVDEYIENYNKISSDHLKHLEDFGENPFMPESYWQELEADTLAKTEKYLKPNDNILDVGVGLGRLLQKVRQDVNKYGVDISMPYLQKTKSSGLEVCMADLENLPYKDSFFDVIISTDVLEHVFDYHKCIHEILRVLKPDGVFIMRVPYNENLKAYINYKDYKFVHVRSFDEQMIELQFDKIYNCKLIETSYSGLIKMDEKLKHSFVEYNDLPSFLGNFFLAYSIAKTDKGRSSFYALLLRKNVIRKPSFIKKVMVYFFYELISLFSRRKPSDDVLYDNMEISVVIKKNN